MERHGVRQISPDSVVVPLSVWQQVEGLFTEMDSFRKRLDDLEAVQVTGSEWLNRQQAMTFLHVGSTKLWELQRSGTLLTSTSNGKILYSIESCRDYLSREGFSQAHVQARFAEILRKRAKK